MFRLKITSAEVNRVARAYACTPSRIRAMGFYLWQQVKDRFATRGASGGTPWPEKKMKSWGYDDGRAILTGASGELLDSFNGWGEGNRAWVGSVASYAHVHQLGTVGKGGVLPTIRPKRAKALFIPITDRAIHSERLTGPAAAMLRVGPHGGMRYSETPIRAAARTVGYQPGRSLGGTVYEPLVKGRLKDGKLQRWDAVLGAYVDGVPDFIFLRKVDIAPRPMLPNAAAERQAQHRLIADTFRPNAPSSN